MREDLLVRSRSRRKNVEHFVFVGDEFEFVGYLDVGRCDSRWGVASRQINSELFRDVTNFSSDAHEPVVSDNEELAFVDLFWDDEDDGNVYFDPIVFVDFSEDDFSDDFPRFVFYDFGDDGGAFVFAVNYFDVEDPEAAVSDEGVHEFFLGCIALFSAFVFFREFDEDRRDRHPCTTRAFDSFGALVHFQCRHYEYLRFGQQSRFVKSR